MQITLDVSEKVAARAEADGVSVEAFVKKVAERAADPEITWDPIGPGPYSPEEAVRNIRELSKNLTLGGGITWKELIHGCD
jgi:hypothetical protein